MFLDSRLTLVALCCGALALPACRGGGGGGGSSDTETAGTDSTGGTTDTNPTASETEGEAESQDETGNDDGPDPGTQAPSARPRVKFKTAQRYATDLSNALEIPRESLCTELDDFDCAAVHRIALGEVDAFGLRLFEPLENMPLTAPIAVDRIGLTACGERAQRDFDAPGQAVSFSEVASGDASASNRDAVVERLYRQLLLREATDREVEQVTAMYDDLPSSNQAQTWAQMACFVIATSTEALFY
ncbi:MAG: hypothetical protein ACE37F_02165 [Nannocystaceae bacterium]|nr:hypothetical protein [bacterium]